jgi:hypothetical protein
MNRTEGEKRLASPHEKRALRSQIQHEKRAQRTARKIRR